MFNKKRSSNYLNDLLKDTILLEKNYGLIVKVYR